MLQRSNQTVILACLLLTSLIASSGAGQESSPLALETRMPLANVKGRIDHFSVDVKGQRLFMAAVDNHTLEVVNLKDLKDLKTLKALNAGKQVHTITDLAEPQGVFYDASTNRLFVACALDGAVKIFDGSTFDLLATVKFPDDADNVRYDSNRKRVIVGYAGAKQLRKRTEGTGGLGFLDASSNGKKIGDIVIDAHPESFQLEKAGSRLFVNVPDKKEIEVIDMTKRTVLARWPVTSAEDNFPMALDEDHHRLIVGCNKPPRLLVFDTETGKQVASAEIAGGTDDLFYDSRLGRIYVLTARGFLDVFQQKDPDHYDRIASYPDPPHTQTGLFVPEWGKLFAASPSQGDQSAEIRVYQAN